MDLSSTPHCHELGCLTHAPCYCHGGGIIPTFLFAVKQNFTKGWHGGLQGRGSMTAEGSIAGVARPVTTKSPSMEAGALPSTLFEFSCQVSCLFASDNHIYKYRLLPRFVLNYSIRCGCKGLSESLLPVKKKAQ